MKNGVTTIPETASETSKGNDSSQSSISSEEHSSKVQMDRSNFSCCRGTEENIILVEHYLQDKETLPTSDLDLSITLVPNSNSMTALKCMTEEKVPTQLSIACLQWPEMEQNSDVTGKYSPSESNKLSDLDDQKGGLDDAGECSSSSNSATASLEHTSTQDLCVFVLKSNGLIGEMCQSSTYSSIEHYGGSKAMLCKKCRKSGNALKMLICDLCEEAFHMACCSPGIKKLPIDYWYCQPCSKKNPWYLFDGKSINTEISGVKRHKYLDPISSMLQDKGSYATRVRIGKDFQAEVPTWSPLRSKKYKPVTCDVPIEVDPAEYVSPNTRKFDSSNSYSIGNWLQCRATNDDGTICGKWRRAPLHESQSPDWDCSCALPWDPIHADCAVPQVVDTDVVLGQLQLLEKLKPRLDNKRCKTG